MQNLQEKAMNLKSEMEKVTNEIVVAVQNGKTLKVKRLSVKLTEIASELNKVEKEIKEANTVIETIVDGEYTIEIKDDKYLTIVKNDDTLKLSYSFGMNVSSTGSVHHAYTRSSATINDKQYLTKDNHWANSSGKISKHVNSEIRMAEDVLFKYISFYGGRHQVN